MMNAASLPLTRHLFVYMNQLSFYYYPSIFLLPNFHRMKHSLVNNSHSMIQLSTWNQKRKWRTLCDCRWWCVLCWHVMLAIMSNNWLRARASQQLIGGISFSVTEPLLALGCGQEQHLCSLVVSNSGWVSSSWTLIGLRKGQFGSWFTASVSW